MNPLLGLLGFNGPPNDQQTLGMANDEWPPRWWKMWMLGINKDSPQPHPPVLPTTVVNGVQSRARAMQAEDTRLHADDIRTGAAHPLPVYSPATYQTLAARELAINRNANPPVNKPKVIEPWVNNWVRDTIFPIAGGPPPQLKVGETPPIGLVQSILGGYTRGMISSGTTGHISRVVTIDPRAAPGDPTGSSPEADRVRFNDTLVHEMGHVLDLRKVMPELDQIAANNIRNVDPRHYAATNPEEYKATAFEIAAGLIHEALAQPTPAASFATYQKRVAEEDANLPGVGEVASLLLRQPILANTPLAHAYRQQLNSLMGLQTVPQR